MADQNQTLRVRITGTVAGLVSAANAARTAIRGLGDESKKTSGPTRSATGHLLRLAGVLRAVGTIATPALVVGAIPGILGMAAALAQASQAGLLLPGALLAVLSVVGALKIATSGFGEALKNVGDPAKFAEAAAKLTPAARAAAEAVRDLKAPFDQLRNSLQERLFAGLAPQIKAVGSALLTTVGPAFTAIAGSANAALSGVLTDLGSLRRQADISSIVGDSADAFGDLFAAVRPLVGAFTDVAVVGAGFLPGLTEGAGAAAQRFADMVARMRESGQLQQIIAGGLSALGDLAKVAGNIGSILGGVFSAAQISGGGFLATLVQITGSLAGVVNSAAGQTALGAFFATIATVAGTVGDVLRTLAPVISTVLQGVQAGIGALAPAIAPLAAAFGQVITALSPLLPLIGQVAGIIAGALGTALAALAPALGTVVNAFTAAMAPVLPVIAAALQSVATALGPVLAAIAGALAPVLTALAPILGQIATVLAGVLVQAFAALTPAITALAPVLGEVAATIGQALLIAITALAPLIPQIVGGFVQLVVAISPLLPAIAQIVGLAAQLIAALAPVVGLILSIVIPAVTILASILSTVLGAAISLVVGILRAAVAVFGGAFAFVVTVVTAAVDTVAGVLRGLVGIITGAINTAVGIARGGFNAFVGAVSGGVEAAMGFVRSLPGRILGALGDLGGLLFSAGRNIIQGLINGIRAMIGAVGSAISGVARKIRDALPFSPAKYGPLRIHPPERSGRRIVELLSAGMLARQSQLRTTMARISGSVAGSLTGPVPSLAGAVAPGPIRRGPPGAPDIAAGLGPVLEAAMASALTTVFAAGVRTDVDYDRLTLRLRAADRARARQ